MIRALAILLITVLLLVIFGSSAVIGWGVRIGGLYAALTLAVDIAAWLINGAKTSA